jgi:MSHA biogenesis protein MshL
MKLKNSLISNALVLAAALVITGCQTYGVGEEVKPHIRDELNRSQNTPVSKPAPPPQLNQELLSEVARYQSLPAPTSQKMFAVSANNVV